MAASSDLRALRLHFGGPAAGGHALPAAVLVNSIQQLQRVVYLLAKEHRGEPAGKRLSADLKGRFGLVCKLPVAGGYDLPVTIGAATASDEDVFAVGKLFRMVSHSLAHEFGTFEHLVSDAECRQRIVHAYKAIRPSPHLGLELVIEDGEGTPILRHSDLQVVWNRPELATPDSVERGRVAGTLVQIGFAKKSIALEHRGGRKLTATYAPGSEAALLSHPRQLIEVRGTVCYDEAGDPVSIADIDEVTEVDESPMEVEDVVYGNVRYSAKTPLRFDVAFHREDALYDLEGPFGITLSAESREDLADALEAELQLLLADYAEGDPAQMSSGAGELREQLRSRFGLR